jgi:hypothetical protein
MEAHGESGQPQERGIIELAYIRSVNLVRFDGEEGYFDDRVFVSLEQVMASGDPWGYCKHRLGQSLAACVKASGIPLNEGAWLIQFGPFAQANFNVPPTAVL